MKHTAGTQPANPDDQAIFSAELQEQIRKRAYEIYEQNGRRDGLAEQDWLHAETEILGSAALKAAA